MLKLLAALILSIILILPSISYAQDTNDLVKQLNEKQAEIAKYQESLNSARKQESSLKNQLNIIDSQAKITQLKMDETKLKIEKLEREIIDLSGRITRISSNVDHLSEVLLKRIVQTYKFTSNVNQIDLLFSSKGFSDFLQREKYIQVAQANDKKVLYQLQATKIAYNDQKQDREARQTEAEKLNKDLSKYQAQLDQSKKDKEQLLKVTKNDEAKFQSRINELAKEISQIQNAAKILISTEPRQVARGEVIGLMGNTGYSFGDHLHFGVYNTRSLSEWSYYSNYENPTNVLRSASVRWWDAPNCDDAKGSYPDKIIGNGSFDWPMDLGSLKVSQGFGDTCYSGRLYGGKPHPALDMFNNSQIAVKAIDEGQAYFCRNCLKDGGNGVFIFHPNGKMTLYWHLQ